MNSLNEAAGVYRNDSRAPRIAVSTTQGHRSETPVGSGQGYSITVAPCRSKARSDVRRAYTLVGDENVPRVMPPRSISNVMKRLKFAGGRPEQRDKQWMAANRIYENERGRFGRSGKLR
jgi:hypothetical protein